MANIDEKPYYQNQSLIRPAEVHNLIADPRKAEIKLGWKAKNDWKAVLEDMFASDYQLAKESVVY